MKRSSGPQVSPAFLSTGKGVDPMPRGRAYRLETHRKKLKRTLRMAVYMAYPRSIYVERDLVNGKWVLGKYAQYRKSSKVQTYHKRRFEKAVRRAQDLPPRGNGYRRLYDYWWSID